MHTLGFEAAGWGQALVHHNGDWSGPIRLCAWRKPLEAQNGGDPPDLEATVSERGVVRLVAPPLIDTSRLPDLLFAAGMVVGQAKTVAAFERVVERYS